ncbi:MAG: TrmH family RNA methyltransferase [Saprospiraceae bacterium]
MPLSKNKLKQLRALQRKKIRQQEGLFLAEGVKIAEELLQQTQVPIREVFATENWLTSNANLVNDFHGNVHAVTQAELKQISTLETANQVLLIAETPQFKLNKTAVENGLSLYLDDLQDPGNLGTILRIADWFGITQVFLSKGCVEVYNSKVIQASMGAFLRVKTLEINLLDLKNQFSDLPIYGALMNGENIFQMDLSPNGILVIGNEGRGISDVTQQLLTHKITIPKGQNGGAESLNAGVATGILCAQFFR